MPRLVPERTVDSSLAIEIVQHSPTALIWSPTNTKGMWDHEVTLAAGRAAIFERKAVDESATGDWTAPIDLVQLDNYSSLSWPVLYVLLAEPRSAPKPWIRRGCREGSCGSASDCLACHSSGARRMAGYAKHVAGSTIAQRLQPWFCHWAWVIEAHSLQSSVVAAGVSLATQKGYTQSASDKALRSHSGAVRLCHWLDSAVSSSPGPLPGLVLTDPDHLDLRDQNLLVLDGQEVRAALADVSEVSLGGQRNPDQTPPVLAVLGPV